jgi:DNA-binding cell septation regulator SpoVG
MPISSVKVWPLEKEHPKIKANCRIYLDEKIAIQASVRKSEKGLWVALPGHFGKKDGQEKWFDDVACTSKEARDELTQKVVSAYNDAVGNEPTNQGEAAGPTDQTKDTDQIPFG